MRASVAAGTGVLGGVAVHAAGERRCLVGMACLAFDFCDLIRVRILLDVGVAVVALETAVNAVAEGFSIYCDAVAGGVSHAGVAVASQTVGLTA